VVFWTIECSVISMNTSRIVAKDLGPNEAPCPRCGELAEWTFFDTARARVEVHCPDCGRFELSRAEFDQNEAEIVEAPEPRE
jgi:predicted RNA-binding Zn-ribbon protein involved in translation (DUF1610 family)